MKNVLVVLAVLTVFVMLLIITIWGFILGHYPTAIFVAFVLAGFAQHAGQEIIRARRGMRQ